MWPIVILFVCSLIMVIILTVVLLQYRKFRKIQGALKEAWGSVEVQSTMLLAKNDSLGRLDNVTARTVYLKTESLIVADHVTRVQLGVSEDVEISSPKDAVLVSHIYSPVPAKQLNAQAYKQPILGSVWMYPDKVMVVAFRATVTDYEKLRDTDAQQVVWHGGVRVHRGFYDMYHQRVREVVLKAIATYTPTKLYTGGHSLGGAMSTCLLFDLAHETDVQTVICGFTYGCPRVGDPRFAQVFGEHMLTGRILFMYRESNQADVITDMPLPVTPNMEDHADVLHYEHSGHLRVFNTNLGTYKKNHALSTYITYISEQSEVS